MFKPYLTAVCNIILTKHDSKMKNFDFLKEINGFEQVYNYCNLVEQYQTVNPEVSAQNGRLALESLVKIIYQLKQWPTPERSNLYSLVTDERFESFINNAEMMKRIHYIRKVGNNAMHPGENVVTRKESFFLLLNLYYFVGNIMQTWLLIDELPKFDKTLVPSHINQAEPHIHHTPTQSVAIEDATTAAANSAANATSSQEQPTALAVQNPTEISEAETRRIYIDLLLKEAGWEVVNTEGAIVSSKACIEIKVNGMPNPSGKGSVDYVLFGNNGLPLAVIEAKRTSIDPIEGRRQAELYADCLMAKYNCQRPVIYYTNGFTTNVIDGLGYPSRPVIGFHTQKELMLMISQRNRSNITDLTINDNITDRDYQKRVIGSVCSHFNSLHRRALLVMATGTGKTRVSISIVDVLARNNWIKNVLFLADRTELVKQAKKNFEKLLPSQTCSLLMEKKCDKNARILFSTYHTMINYIDQDNKEFSIGRFDLIIIDEAHRSVFGKFSAIFNYFDSLLLGLTATPRDEIDRSTYQLFGMEQGMPTDSYEYQEAVDNGYLVPYNAISITSEILTQGIIEEQLSDAEKEELKAIFEYEKTRAMMDGDYKRNIKPTEIFSYIHNTDTVDKVLDNLMTNGLKVDDEAKIGKTIIFAYNHKHAMLITERFNALYPELGPDFCRVIDNYEKYAESILDSFKDINKMPQIAVSIDMLDTGIDVPEVLNLVFFKPVHSKIKFWQMIGRGTRLCKDLFGPNKDKTGFMIYDHWGNFNYFNMTTEENENTGRLSIVGRLFNLRVDLKTALQSHEYQENEPTRALHNELADILCRQVSTLNRSRIDVRVALSLVDSYSIPTNWICLSPIQAQDIKDNLAQLLIQKAEDVMALQFDALLLKLQLSLVDSTVKARACQNNVINISKKLSKKATIPQVIQKMELLREVQTPQFWQNKTLDSLEHVRLELRDLVQYLIESGDGRTFTINIEDTFTQDEGQATVSEIKNYHQRVIDYLSENLQDDSVLQKIYHLEPLQEEDIRKLERIFWNDLGTHDEYQEQIVKLPFVSNIATFIRSIIGIDQEDALQKYRNLVNDTKMTRIQEEYLRTIIRYVCQNGDIRRDILTNQQPFASMDISSLFGDNAGALARYVDMIHDSIA